MSQDPSKKEIFEVQEELFKFISGLKPGIWMVEKSKDANKISFICSPMEGLPKAMNTATFDRVRTKAARKISAYLKKSKKCLAETGSGFPTTKDIIECIREVL